MRHKSLPRKQMLLETNRPNCVTSSEREPIAVVQPKGYCNLFARRLSRLTTLHCEISINCLYSDMQKTVQQLLDLKPKIVITSEERDWVEVLRETGLPVIVIRPRRYYSNAINIAPDDVSIGTLAAGFLFSLGFSHFAFAGTKHPFSELRLSGFQSALSKRKIHDIAVFDDVVRDGYMDFHSNISSELIHWLSKLPCPAAVFASDDSTARALCVAAASLELSVPEDISVLGVDNDVYLCKGSLPQLSSIDLNEEALLEMAVDAALNYLNGKAHLGDVLTAPSPELKARESTDTISCDDVLICRCMAWMRKYASILVTISDMCDALHLARRTVERRFKENLHESPNAVLNNIRIQKVMRMLLSSDMPIEVVAEKCGFSNGTRMGIVFKKHIGVSPMQFRKNGGKVKID